MDSSRDGKSVCSRSFEWGTCIHRCFRAASSLSAVCVPLPLPLPPPCSAGVGRTGTFIALDTLLQVIKESDAVDIFGLVCQMRQQRNHMIQTEAQYVFIHKVLLQVVRPTTFSTLSRQNNNYQPMLSPSEEGGERRGACDVRGGEVGVCKEIVVCVHCVCSVCSSLVFTPYTISAPLTPHSQPHTLTSSPSRSLQLSQRNMITMPPS